MNDRNSEEHIRRLERRTESLEYRVNSEAAKERALRQSRDYLFYVEHDLEGAYELSRLLRERYGEKAV